MILFFAKACADLPIAMDSLLSSATFACEPKATLSTAFFPTVVTKPMDSEFTEPVPIFVDLPTAVPFSANTDE